MGILSQRSSSIMGETIQVNNLFKYLNGLKQKYFFLKQSNYETLSWVFNHLNLNENDVILDLDCHYAELWIKNDLSLYPSIKVFLVDQNLVNVRLTQAKCFNSSFNHEIELMDYDTLQYSSNQFDKVITKIGFNVLCYHKQLAMINESCRVLKKHKNGYYVINEDQLTKTLNQFLIEFDSTITLSNQINCNTLALKQRLQSLFEKVEYQSYHSELKIKTVSQMIDMYLSANPQTFIDEIVKKHRIKEFDSFLAKKIENQACIPIDIVFTLLIGKNKL